MNLLIRYVVQTTEERFQDYYKVSYVLLILFVQSYSSSCKKAAYRLVCNVTSVSDFASSAIVICLLKR
jgi:hypothetical protein